MRMLAMWIQAADWFQSNFWTSQHNQILCCIWVSSDRLDTKLCFSFWETLRHSL